MDRFSTLLIRAIRANLSEDLLASRYRGANRGSEYGHCYVASEALWHMLGGASQRYAPRYARSAAGDTHWWLQDGDVILDPTARQFTATELRNLYPCGRRCGFLTLAPSRRAQILIQRVELSLR